MPNDFNQYQPYTGFTTTGTGLVAQDLGQRYVTKSYLLDVYPNISSTLGSRTSPGLFTWGLNDNGQLGLGDIVHRSSPVQVGSLTNWKQVSSSPRGSYAACIKTDSTLWTWGLNTNGQLGLGNIVHRSSPVQVGSLTNWKKVSVAFPGTLVGYYMTCIKTDGTLWAWGMNQYGQLSTGDVVHRSSPVQVGSLTNWKQISGGSGILDGSY